MSVKSIAVTDYSTGSQYQYSGTDGTWQSITAVNGKVVSTGKNDAAIDADVAPSTTGTTNGPMPFQGTHAESSSSVIQPNAGGWTPTTLSTSSTATVTTYPGLPAGWTVTSSGKVLPPSAASVSELPFDIAITPHSADFGQVTSPQVSSTSLPAGSQQVRPFQLTFFLFRSPSG